MYKLPLFPLNTVLFPGMPLRLHIFEDRYKQMMNQCLQTHQPFGVVLIREGVEVGGPLAEPYSVGCTAQIMQVEPLDHGRMNITAIGEERFRILSLARDQVYLAGVVESSPLSNSGPKAMKRAGRNLRPWVEQYLDILTKAGNVQFDSSQLPEDPLALAYLTAYLIQVPPAQKQELLALEQAARFVDSVAGVCRREVLLLNTIIERESGEDERPFSLN